MAQCKLCNKKGLFLMVNRNGLCKNCASILAVEVQSRLRVLDDSHRIVKNSKKYKTLITRYDVILENAKELLKYELAGIETINPKPSEIIEIAKADKEDCTIDEIRKTIYKAVQKSELGSTPAGKINPLTKCMAQILELRENLIDKNLFYEYEDSLNMHIHKTKFSIIMDKAKKFEFKENYKKSLDQYQEALYYIKKNGLDKEVSEDDMRSLESKIDELKNK